MADSEASIDDLKAIKDPINKLLVIKDAITKKVIISVDVQDVMVASSERHAFAHTDIRAKVSQVTFLAAMKKYDFHSAEHNDLAKKLIAMLESVELIRIR